jgi:hypothetical protein
MPISEPIDSNHLGIIPGAASTIQNNRSCVVNLKV